jgi:hypothetical protein
LRREIGEDDKGSKDLKHVHYLEALSLIFHFEDSEELLAQLFFIRTLLLLLGGLLVLNTDVSSNCPFSI